MTVSHAWRALRHPSFRLFVGGQSISVIGTWMTRMGTHWLVYRLTGSALVLGIVRFASQKPPMNELGISATLARPRKRAAVSTENPKECD
jgi:hypothetical protein